MNSLFESLIPARSLIISCQASDGNPLKRSDIMALMARAGELGGAAGVRANGVGDVAEIANNVNIPIIGINKQGNRHGVYITPTVEAAVDVIKAGAKIVAMDGTLRPRLDGTTFAEQVSRVKAFDPQVAVMADIHDLESGLAAVAAGADAIATTLSGYYPVVTHTTAPDIALIAELASVVSCPIIAEGRIRDEHDLNAAYDAGAYAVVVGTALTNPMDTMRRLVAATRSDRS